MRKESTVERNAVKFPGKEEVYFLPSDSNHFKCFSLHLEKKFVTAERPRMLEDKVSNTQVGSIKQKKLMVYCVLCRNQTSKGGSGQLNEVLGKWLNLLA